MSNAQTHKADAMSTMTVSQDYFASYVEDTSLCQDAMVQD